MISSAIMKSRVLAPKMKQIGSIFLIDLESDVCVFQFVLIIFRRNNYSSDEYPESGSSD